MGTSKQQHQQPAVVPADLGEVQQIERYLERLAFSDQLVVAANGHLKRVWIYPQRRPDGVWDRYVEEDDPHPHEKIAECVIFSGAAHVYAFERFPRRMVIVLGERGPYHLLQALDKLVLRKKQDDDIRFERVLELPVSALPSRWRRQKDIEEATLYAGCPEGFLKNPQAVYVGTLDLPTTPEETICEVMAELVNTAQRAREVAESVERIAASLNELREENFAEDL